MQFLRPRTLLIILGLVLTQTLAAAANSPSADDKITGRITDSVSGEPIVGASVIIEGTQRGTLTDADGRFELKSSGPATILVSYISYIPQQMEVSPASPVEIALSAENIEVSGITVRGRVRKDTENAMVATVKNLPMVASGISASQITKSPDRDASEVVRRVPGITIIDDRFVIVRGLSQRYNNAWINGQAVPSTETDSRAFSFDLIPSSQIDNILVYKSPAPEIPADFAGGFVVITSKGVPDRNTFEIGYTTGFNVKTQFKCFLENPGSGTDFLGFDNNKRPLPGNFPSHMAKVTDPDKITDLTLGAFNNDWSRKIKTPLPDQRFSASIARRIDTRRGRLVGNISAINYSNTYKSVRDISNNRYGIYSAAGDAPVFLEKYTDTQFSHDVRLGAMHNWTVQLDADNRIEFKNLFNILGRNRLTERSGFRYQSGTYFIEQTEMLYSSRLTYSGQVAGDHSLRDGSRIDWNAGYSFANRNEPDRRIVTNIAGISDDSDRDGIVTKNDNITRYYQTLHDHIFSSAINYKRDLSSGSIVPVLKVGAYGEYRDRTYDPREFVYNYTNLGYDVVQNYIKLPYEQMMDQSWLGADKVFIEEKTDKTNGYSATVNMQALYGALELPIGLPLGQITVYAGVRAENYMMTLRRDKSKSYETVLKDSKKHNSLDVLPSVNLTWKLSAAHQFRAAYGRSLNRPELREVSPSVYYDFDLFSEIGGNENLKTAYIDNLDLRWEYYPSHGEVVSVGVFWKRFRNPIEWSYIDMGGTLRYNYENAHSAVSRGIEVDIRKNFDFLRLPDLYIVVNASWIDSNIRFEEGELLTRPDRPMQGQSPYVINAGLFYQSERAGVAVSLLYNRIGKRIVGIGKSNSANNDVNSMIPDSYEMPRNTLDFSLTKTFRGFIDLKLTVKDVLSEDVVYKQFPEFESSGLRHKRSQVTKKYNPGQSFTIGVSFKIN